MKGRPVCAERPEEFQAASGGEEAEAGHLVAALNTPEDVSSLGNPEG